MPRATNAPASKRRHKSRLKLAKGFRGSRSKLFRQATEAVRINAACRTNGIVYSRFIEGLSKSNVTINRKMLSEIAIYDEAGFTKLVETAKAAIA